MTVPGVPPDRSAGGDGGAGGDLAAGGDLGGVTPAQSQPPAEQISLIPPGRGRPAQGRATQGRGAQVRPAQVTEVAEVRPVARVAVMSALPHLDRPFDYLVPARLADAAVPGARVRVRLAGRLMDGFVLERVDRADDAGSPGARVLAPITSVHGPAVLTEPIARLCRAVADRYAGTLADVLRFAVPPRHARAERSVARPGPSNTEPGPSDTGPGANVTEPGASDTGRGPSNTEPGPSDTELRPTGGAVDHGPAQEPPPAWSRYRGGAELIEAVTSGRTARAVWISAAGERPADRIAELVSAACRGGGGAIVVVADAAEMERIGGRLAEMLGPIVVRLAADLGPEARYRAFLRVLSGTARVVVGTRSAVFAPVVGLRLIVVWDDLDEALSEPQAPGWHAREVAALRSAGDDISLVLGGASVSLEAARMASTGWLPVVDLPRPVLRSAMPRVRASGGDPRSEADGGGQRIPSDALAAMRDAVATGPVLVQVPRAGYLPALSCQSCRELVRCPVCSTPMRAESADRRPVCPTHGSGPPWVCPFCGGRRVRAVVTGVRRTAEEFGRALPGVPVLSSDAGHVPAALPERCLVVATPGAHPDPGPAGYSAVVLLDVTAALSRPGLRVAEEVLWRWFAVAALVRPAADGGQVIVVGDPALREVQALVRWDPLGYATRALEERRQLALAPAVRTALVVGPALESAEVAAGLAADLDDRVLRRSGPIVWSPRPDGTGSGERTLDDTALDAVTGWVVAVSIADGPLLSAAVARLQAARSARKAPVVLTRMDPISLEPSRTSGGGDRTRGGGRRAT